MQGVAMPRDLWARAQHARDRHLGSSSACLIGCLTGEVPLASRVIPLRLPLPANQALYGILPYSPMWKPQAGQQVRQDFQRTAFPCRIRRKPSRFKGKALNYLRIALAFLGATVAYFGCGFAMFGALPRMKSEFMKYPNVYRSHDDMMKVMPYNVVAILISIVVVAVLYAKIYPAGGGIASGIYLGVLIGSFSVCNFVLHNYATLNIGLTLTLYEGITYFIQWVIVGVTIGLIYKPSYSVPRV